MPKKLAKKPKPKKAVAKTKAVVRERKRRSRKLLFQSVKGMHDILPQEQWVWEKIRESVKELADFYNFQRIDTPIVESAELFERGVGQATDIVEKQMFRVGGSKDDLVLRPENTAAVMRAYAEHGLSHLGQPAKLYAIGPMFRHEQPQEGRFRQFHQASYDIIGGDGDSIYDAQTVLVAYRLLEALKINKLKIQINTIGCRSCRALYRRRLLDYYRSRHVCADCNKRKNVNPLRLLDCKTERCEEIKKGAPTILDNLCNGCNCHFQTVLEYLEELELPYELNPQLVRGLDYYNRTVFEIFAEGVNSALAGGGRYDLLAEMLGGRMIPAVGVAIGLERLVALIKQRDIKFVVKKKPTVFLIHIGNLAKKKSLFLIEELRKAGIRVKEALGKESLRVQLRAADKEKTPLSLIFGQKEAFEDSIIVRDMDSGSQETIPLSKFVARVKKKLK